MKVTLTLKVEVEVEAADHELVAAGADAAGADVLYETGKALDYWFDHTDRSMSAQSIVILADEEQA
jgi:hypothetical protein